MKSSDPYRARCNAEISIHDALYSIEHFAANYPAERLSSHDALRLRRAAELWDKRVAEYQFSQVNPPAARVTTTTEHMGAVEDFSTKGC